MSDEWLSRQMGGVGGKGRHTTAAICSRGHVITTDVERFAGAVTKFCSKCGGEVTTNCKECGAPIHGHYVPPDAPGVGGILRTPAHCHECGKPYPWTTEKVSAAKDLADELEGLSADDRAKLKSALDDIATAGPKAEVGAARIKKVLGKATGAIGKALWKMSVDIASEAAKKVLLGQ
jgi:hypothetical protein